MLVGAKELLEAAEAGKYAVGAFNVYNLEGVKAVIGAAEVERSPAMLQIHPAALQFGGTALVAACLAAAREASVPAAVHLDHSSSPDAIRQALEAGVGSVMADGSHLTYAENVIFTREMVRLAHRQGAAVEAELGRLSGTEDNLSVPDYEARLTDPAQAGEFASETGIDALAVCIGNVHGRYRSEPCLDFERLERIREQASVPLVLHGASGLPEALVRRSIEIGVSKFNVNTEVRETYLAGLTSRLAGSKSPDLVELLQSVVEVMQAVVAGKLRLFGSTGKA